MNAPLASPQATKTAPPRIKTRERTVYYYRASTTKKISSKTMTLQKAVQASWGVLGKVKERTWFQNGKTIFGMSMDTRTLLINGANKDCIVLTIGITEKGASANVIAVNQSVNASLSSGTYNAPLGSEYLDGEAFICIMDNHILLTPCDALRGNIPNRFMLQMLKKAKNIDASNFTILQVANQATLATVLSQGIKKIDLNAVVFKASCDRLTSTIKPNTFPAKLSANIDAFTNLMMPAKTNAQIVDYDSLNTKLSFTHDSRISSKAAEEECKALTKNARELLESNIEGFSLTTKEGKVITPDKVVLNETITIERHGKSVKEDLTWNQLSQQMLRYHNTGILAK